MCSRTMTVNFQHSSCVLLLYTALQGTLVVEEFNQETTEALGVGDSGAVWRTLSSGDHRCSKTMNKSLMYHCFVISTDVLGTMNKSLMYKLFCHVM